MNYTIAIKLTGSKPNILVIKYMSYEDTEENKTILDIKKYPEGWEKMKVRKH